MLKERSNCQYKKVSMSQPLTAQCKWKARLVNKVRSDFTETFSIFTHLLATRQTLLGFML